MFIVIVVDVGVVAIVVVVVVIVVVVVVVVIVVVVVVVVVVFKDKPIVNIVIFIIVVIVIVVVIVQFFLFPFLSLQPHTAAPLAPLLSLLLIVKSSHGGSEESLVAESDNLRAPPALPCCVEIPLGQRGRGRVLWRSRTGCYQGSVPWRRASCPRAGPFHERVPTPKKRTKDPQGAPVAVVGAAGVAIGLPHGSLFEPQSADERMAPTESLGCRLERALQHLVGDLGGVQLGCCGGRCAFRGVLTVAHVDGAQRCDRGRTEERGALGTMVVRVLVVVAAATVTVGVLWMLCL